MDNLQKPIENTRMPNISETREFAFSTEEAEMRVMIHGTVCIPSKRKEGLHTQTACLVTFR